MRDVVQRFCSYNLHISECFIAKCSTLFWGGASVIFACYSKIIHATATGWWFGTFGLFVPFSWEWNNHPNWLSYSWECHHPNWLSHIFQRARSTTNQAISGIDFSIHPRHPAEVKAKQKVDMSKQLRASKNQGRVNGIPKHLGPWLVVSEWRRSYIFIGKMNEHDARWCPSLLAKLVNITPITMVYGRYNELVNGVYKPTYNWGAPSCGTLFCFQLVCHGLSKS